jgi:hypothetical protein
MMKETIKKLSPDEKFDSKGATAQSKVDKLLGIHAGTFVVGVLFLCTLSLFGLLVGFKVNLSETVIWILSSILLFLGGLFAGTLK